MARFFPVLTLVVAGSLLGGCGWVGEERTYFMKRDFERATGTQWLDSSAKNSGFSSLFATSAEARNEQQICLHPNGEERVVTQNGVSDEVEYRRCALAPYATAGGQRLGNRPEGVGRVVD